MSSEWVPETDVALWEGTVGGLLREQAVLHPDAVARSDTRADLVTSVGRPLPHTGARIVDPATSGRWTTAA